MPVHECAERFAVGVGLQQPGRRRVEAFDLGQHQQVPRPGERRPRREQPADAACPRVLQAAGVVAHRHRHVGVLGGDAQLVEQPAQRRVGAVVVHQEGRVDANGVAVTPIDVVGVGVPAYAGVGFEQGDPVARRQCVGGDKA